MGSPRDFRALVADFGLSLVLSLDGTHLTSDMRGTLSYMAPEVFSAQIVSTELDIYSFGVMSAWRRVLTLSMRHLHVRLSSPYPVHPCSVLCALQHGSLPLLHPPRPHPAQTWSRGRAVSHSLLGSVQQ